MFADERQPTVADGSMFIGITIVDCAFWISRFAPEHQVEVANFASTSAAKARPPRLTKFRPSTRMEFSVGTAPGTISAPDHVFVAIGGKDVSAWL